MKYINTSLYDRKWILWIPQSLSIKASNHVCSASDTSSSIHYKLYTTNFYKNTRVESLLRFYKSTRIDCKLWVGSPKKHMFNIYSTEIFVWVPALSLWIWKNGCCKASRTVGRVCRSCRIMLVTKSIASSRLAPTRDSTCTIESHEMTHVSCYN